MVNDVELYETFEALEAKYPIFILRARKTVLHVQSLHVIVISYR